VGRAVTFSKAGDAGKTEGGPAARCCMGEGKGGGACMTHGG
jgi:hypothetical protein